MIINNISTYNRHDQYRYISAPTKITQLFIYLIIYSEIVTAKIMDYII